MENLYLEAECLFCEIRKNCLYFPCKHFVCEKCYLDNYKIRIKQMVKMIEFKAEFYNGESTCFGCVYRCDESLLTMDPSVLCRIFRENYDEYSANLIEKYRHFFLGVPCYFFKCEFCELVHNGIRPIEFCPVLRQIHEPIFNSTVRDLINNYTIQIFNYSISSFINFNPNVTEEFRDSLVLLNNSKNINFHLGHPLRIFKVSNANLRVHNYFALVSIRIIRENELFVWIDREEDCIIKAIYKIEYI